MHWKILSGVCSLEMGVVAILYQSWEI